MNLGLPLHRLPIRSLILLAGLLVIHVTIPFSGESESAGLIVRSLALLVLCLGGYLLFQARSWVLTYVAISVPALLLGVLAEANPKSAWLGATGGSFSFLVSLLLFVAVIRFALFDREAGRLDRIVAGICGYLLLALLWSSLYQIADRFVADGFRTADGVGRLTKNGEAHYFSLVTITTLGYGDIAPVNPWIRMLASLQALTATLFLAVFISSLVARPLNRPSD
jgi:hypothetical protein